MQFCRVLHIVAENSVIEKEERCLITVDVDKDTSFEEEVELITAETAKYRLGRLHEGSPLYESPSATARKNSTCFNS